MSPTRRQVLMASAGLVTASLAALPAMSAAEELPSQSPRFVVAHTVLVSVLMDDGSMKTLTICDGHRNPDDCEAIGTFSDWHEAHQPYSERIDPRLARSAAQWLGMTGMTIMEMLHESGEITAW